MNTSLMNALNQLESGSLFNDPTDVTLQSADGDSIMFLADAAVADLQNELAEIENSDGFLSYAIDTQMVELDALKYDLEEAEQNGGLTPLEFSLASRLMRKVGLSNEIRLPTLQSFSGSNSRIASTTATLHAVMDTLRNAGAKVKKFILSIIDKITRLASKLFTAGGNIGGKAKKLEEKAGKMGSELRDASAKVSVTADLLAAKDDKFTDGIARTKATVKLLEVGIPAEQELGEKFIKAIEAAIDAGSKGSSTFESACSEWASKGKGAGYGNADTALSTPAGDVYPQSEVGLGGYGLALVAPTSATLQAKRNKGRNNNRSNSNPVDNTNIDNSNTGGTTDDNTKSDFNVANEIVVAGQLKRSFRRLVVTANIPTKAVEIKPLDQSTIQGICGEVKECSRYYDTIRTKSTSLSREMKALAERVGKDSANAEGDEKAYLNAIVKIANNAVGNFITGYMSAAVGSAKRLNAVLNLCDRSIGMYKKA